MSSSPPSSPRSWPLRALLLVLVLVASTLAGCTDSPDRKGPEDEGADDPADEDSLIDGIAVGQLVPKEIGPAVHEVTGAAGPDADEGAFGYVFDEQSRELVPGAIIVAQCHMEGLELPISPQVTEADDHGRFAFAAGALSSCDLVGYQALSPGLLQSTDLTGPALKPEKAYLVLIGLQPVS